ncbi:MAG: DUF58 domain-containing protein [Candidatus Brocadiae bacterium]|nr:DUF58 domain-containing protein [Candidatus Brocadiia bacterium]
MEEYQKYLDPKVLNKIGSLELKARLIVEGYISGLHKSPYHGFSVEFAQHREYVPGDDIRHIDWKVYGKSDRYYIKQYEEETNLISYFLVDSSASMQYSSGEMSKYEYASHIVAALSYLVLEQQDAAGLFLFDKEVKKILPASSNPAHLKDIAHSLSSVVPSEKTTLGGVLHDICSRMRKRGLVVILSDFFDDVEKTLAGLRHFRHRKHDVILFHILDPHEVHFPLQRTTLFEGLEEENLKILANPRALRKAYLQEIQHFLRELKSGCIANRIDYVQFTTDQPLDVALSAYLANRTKTARI